MRWIVWMDSICFQILTIIVTRGALIYKPRLKEIQLKNNIGVDEGMDGRKDG